MIRIINESKLKVRVQVKKSKVVMNWNDWITMPNDMYIDFGIEPIRLADIDYIEIDCFKEVEVGILIDSKINNYFSKIESKLNDLKVDFIILKGNIIRVEF